MFQHSNFDHPRHDCRFGGREDFAEQARQHFAGRGRHSRHGWGPGPWAGFGGGRERLFDAGDIRLVILKLLSEQPSYGYQLIKTMEERLAGGYTPSAGVIYPTLTLLEEEGLAVSSISESNKKIYSVTPDGLAFLDQNKERVAALFERLEEAGDEFRRGRSPEIMKAFMNLRGAVMARVARGNATPEQISRIVEAIDAAAKTIDRL
ncbi:MAG: PadR family transcriptional regulator [Acidobacteriaceae bacterium]